MHTVLKKINSSTIVEFEKIYEFIKRELDHTRDIYKISSDLSAIINILAKENLDMTIAVETVDSFEIDKKIQFNKLDSSRLLIEDFKIYYNLIDKIYSSCDEMGVNRSLAALHIFRVEILMVDAFISCKIFGNPNNYTYAIAR